MKSNFHILITAASRRVSMIKGFRDALNKLGVSGSVHVTDTDPWSTAIRFADKSHIVPISNAKNYLPTLLSICEKENISLIVPTIDEELANFGRWAKKFRAIGTMPLVSSQKVGKICRDKEDTYNWFVQNNFPFAKTCSPNQIDPENAKFPLFIKPRSGRGSVGVRKLSNKRELLFFLDYTNDPIVQTYLSGDEYTIDVLAGFDGRILLVVPRQRLVIRSGVCDRGVTRNDPRLIDLATRICERLDIIGPVNLQLKMHRGKPVFFEINPRFSGAIQLSVASGADFFKLIIEETLGRKPAPAIGQFTDGLMMMSYEDSLFEPDGSSSVKLVVEASSKEFA